MFIACIVVVAAFIAFLLFTFLATRKKVSFQVDESTVLIKNAGNTLKIFVNDTLYSTHFMPELLKGDAFDVKVGEKEIKIKCKCNWFGNKMSVTAFDGEQEVFNNGVVIKEKVKKSK